VKRPIQCPLCPASTQWLSRHLRQRHKLSQEQIDAVIMNCDDYLRRNTTNRKPKLPCPVAGCRMRVTHIGNHLRRKHKTSAFAFRHQADLPSISCTSQSVRDNQSASPELIPSSPQLSNSTCIFPTAGFVTRRQADSLPTSAQSMHDSELITSDVMSDENSCSVPSCSTSSAVTGNEYILGRDLSQTNDRDSSDDSDEALESDVETFVDKDVETIVLGFQQHIASIDGGARARPEMYSLAVRQVLAAVGNSVENLTKENVRKKYVEPASNAGNVSIKTLRNKLRALEYFSTYVLDILNCTDNTDTITSASIVDNLTKLRTVLPLWRKSVRSKCTVEDIRRRIQDGTEQLLPSDINKYLTSEYATYAKHLLHNVACLQGWTPTMCDFTRARNHMLVLLSVGNAHRSGVLINFSLTDYQSGTEMSDGTVVYSVAEHKTCSTHGAASIVVSADEAALLESYVRIRMSLRANCAPYVFINHTGNKMTQSNVATALTVAFSGIYGDRVQRITCTKVRKAAVTQVHQAHPEKRSEVADHMCHRIATAEKHYKYTESQSNSVKCAALLRKTLTDASAPVPDASAPVPAQKRKLQDTASPSVSAIEEPYKKKILWAPDDRDLVKKKFESFVKRRKTPIKEIAAVLNSDVDLRNHLEQSLHCVGDSLTRAVRDKVRSFFRWL